MTPAEAKAAAIIADPDFRFATDPNSAIDFAAKSAAGARNGSTVALPDISSARFWTEVGLRLVAAADNPAIEAGQILTALAAEYHITV